ncbi:sensor domain-containing diguanylate cyclase [Aurantiacibacter zhengii]|uniref:diguanylate cyclase n=1 Tax=Aurantiacibacter zhengii TaxID=2307003 RepID=A0A418NP19_9SPHN|nr:diguanylate cyclase [Aurantiacibacter zhengii]RIV83864.1 sensor domain-containing diguanylate cyclase [Aurantiacibacter zhengii]
MTRAATTMLLALLACLGIVLASERAEAQTTSVAPCRAYSDERLPLSAAIGQLEWTCGKSGLQDGRKVTWLRFDTWDRNDPPKEFSSRITVFDSIAIAALAADGSMQVERYSAGQATPVAAGPTFTVDLPEIEDDTRAILVRIVAPHSVTIGSEARLVTRPQNQTGALFATMFLAMLTGMLVMPLLFDGMFFVVLRERFVLFHACMTISMIVYIGTAGGVVSSFFTLPISLLAIAAPLVWAVGVGFGGLFIASFVERDMLRQWERRALTALSFWSMLVPGFAALQLPWTQSFDNQLYFYAFLPVIPGLICAIVTALMRGSRAARFLAAAWLLVMATAVDRLLKGLGVYVGSDSIDLSMFFALALEVVIVGLGVADRFLAVRRERDRALTEARTLEELSERDALTGLLNRRALEARFPVLRAEGFTAMAVIDVDKFKSVNDLHGHATGDAVLKSVANALRRDDINSLAFRMGGEEFVLLLRGMGAIERAEERRLAITEEVARSGLVPEVVTASMGVVEVPHDALADSSFDALYLRADRLLYEAKACGRDRTMSERLKVFRPRRTVERRVAA